MSEGMAGKRWIGGGIWGWKGVFGAAMRYQSQAALNQTRLLLGTDRVVRVDPLIPAPRSSLTITTDPSRASASGGSAMAAFGDRIASEISRQARGAFPAGAVSGRVKCQPQR